MMTIDFTATTATTIDPEVFQTVADLIHAHYSDPTTAEEMFKFNASLLALSAYEDDPEGIVLAGYPSIAHVIESEQALMIYAVALKEGESMVTELSKRTHSADRFARRVPKGLALDEYRAMLMTDYQKLTAEK